MGRRLVRHPGDVAGPRRARRGLMCAAAHRLLDDEQERGACGRRVAAPRLRGSVPVPAGARTRFDGTAARARRRADAACEALDAAARVGSVDAENAAVLAADALWVARQWATVRDVERRRVACLTLLAPRVAAVEPVPAPTAGPERDDAAPPDDGPPDRPRAAALTLCRAPQAPPTFALADAADLDAARHPASQV